MTETGFTPGPWEAAYPTVIDGIGYGQLFIRTVDDDVHLVMSGSGGAKSYTRTIATLKGNDVDEANARLIAAAPDLYEAIKSLLPILRAVRYTTGLGPNQMKRIEAAEAALAKANPTQEA